MSLTSKRRAWLRTLAAAIASIGLFALLGPVLKLFVLALLPAVAVLIAITLGLFRGGVAFVVICAALLITMMQPAEAATDTSARQLAPLLGLLVAVVPVAYAGRTRHRLERLLERSREHEALLGAVMDALPAQIAIADRDGQYLFVNRRWAEEVGSDVSADGGLEPSEVHERQQGERSYQLSGFRVPNDRGEVFAYGTVAFDITERKAQEQQLRYSEAYNRALIGALPDTVVRLDRAGHFRDVIVPPHAPHSFAPGRPPETLHGLSLDAVLDADTARHALDKLEAAFATGAVQTLEYATTDRDTPGYREMRMTRLDDDAVLALVRDVTDRTQAELALRASNRHKDEFLATMSHELRTPLNAVLGFAEILEECYFGPLNDQQLGYVRDIRTAGQQQLTLLGDILDVVTVDTDGLELKCSWVTVGPLVEETLRLVRERAESRDITLGYEPGYEPATDLPALYADPRRLKQMLYNYLSNAIKFTPPGGAVTLAVYDRAETIDVEVRDTGIGIAPEGQAKLFRAFTQLDSSLARQYQGTGLGLLLVKRLAERHGGRVWLRSVPDEGSTFGFALPKTADAARQVEGEIPHPRTASESPEGLD
ncbi:MAG: ATP-binding protein [Trueperaceae bacterium]|nr:ATP-binding protein [Trueperaceae bacterium]